MSIETQIETCSEHYKIWKNKALFSNDLYEARKAIDRAFFWMELRSAFIFLHTIEQTNGQDKKVKQSLIQAKMNLSRKLSEYMKETLKGI
ncbi:MAG: hypothetical protein HYW22_00350 [Candidatus Aenigmarchaeota archaeon]|nr:hypothetical protein [Candidatus Aenigmarchaeota archaeon]